MRAFCFETIPDWTQILGWPINRPILSTTTLFQTSLFFLSSPPYFSNPSLYISLPFILQDGYGYES